MSKKVISLAVILITLFMPHAYSAEYYEPSTGTIINPPAKPKFPLTDTKLKQITEKALAIARDKLSKNPNDKIGQMMLNLAHHFSPTNRDVLLVRGKLKFKIKIDEPRRSVSKKEFLQLLRKSVEQLPNRNTEIVRHFRILLYQIIRQFDPYDEDAIITLMSYDDKGIATDIKPLLAKNIHESYTIQYDSKDERYIVSNVKKTIFVPANVPWTDTWVKVKVGKIVRVHASRLWSMGTGTFPYCGPNGMSRLSTGTTSKTRTVTKTSSKTKVTTTTSRTKVSGEVGQPGCLMAKVGSKTYYVGEEAVFKVEKAGILLFGPYEWDTYSDNSGKLQVTFEVSDR